MASPWRDLPEELVPWQTAWKRHRRWSVDGTDAEIFAAVQPAHGIDTADLDAGVQKLLSADSTSVLHVAGDVRIRRRRDAVSADGLAGVPIDDRARESVGPVDVREVDGAVGGEQGASPGYGHIDRPWRWDPNDLPAGAVSLVVDGGNLAPISG
jgi:transposase